VPLLFCVAAIAVLRVNNPTAFLPTFHTFTTEQSTLWYVFLNASKMLQVRYFIVRYEAKFSKCDLRFAITFESSALLVACMKPSCLLSAKRLLSD